MIDVSIIVPVYNVSNFIERCARTLFEQTFSNLEFIFVDDCTPDNSITILNTVLEDYSHRKNVVKIIKHEINKGLAAARNTGIQYANGQYVMHIDSDDYVEKDMISVLFEKAKTESADIVICDFYLQWHNTQKYVKQNYNTDKVSYVSMILRGEALPTVWNKLIKKDLYTNHKISAVPGVNYAEDLSVVPKLCYYAAKIVKVDKAFIHYVQYNTTSYTKGLSEKSLKSLLKAYEVLTDFFSTKPELEYRKALNEGMALKKIELIKQIDNTKLPILLSSFPNVKFKHNLNFIDSLLNDLMINNRKKTLKTVLYFYNIAFDVAQYLKRRK